MADKDIRKAIISTDRDDTEVRECPKRIERMNAYLARRLWECCDLCGSRTCVKRSCKKPLDHTK